MTKKKKPFILILLSISLFSITACSQTKKSLGLERERPDEFTVLEHPPLSMPPGLGLKPPQTTSSATTYQDTQLQAKELLIKNSSQNPTIGNVSPIEQALLQNARIENTQPDIRDKVNQEAKVSKPGAKVIKKIIFWEDKPTGDVINPQEEYKKLHNKEAPGPLNQ